MSDVTPTITTLSDGAIRVCLGTRCATTSSQHLVPDKIAQLQRTQPAATTMQQLFSFSSLPDLPTLQRRLWNMTPPFSVEIRQAVEAPPLSGNNDPYYELIDCETLRDLYDFLHSDDYGIAPHEPFTLDIEEVQEEPEESWNDHPSLTISERN